ncbi:ThiF family adenylyltransferase [Thermodesulfobacteriota bacterium]
MKPEILKEIESLSGPGELPDGTSYQRLSVENTEKISRDLNVSGRDIEIAALETDVIPERYVRNMKTFSSDDQATLLRSQVCVVGLGGLGGAVTEILARVGIGTLKLIDGDTFEDSNFNRQFLCTRDQIAKPKAETAAKRVHQVNSSIVVLKHHAPIDESNSVTFIEHSDVVVDCLDNVPTRFTLERASKEIGSPLVSAAIAGVSGHVTTIFPEDRGLELIYGKKDHLPIKGVETSLGCLPQAVTVLAALECSEVVKILLNKGDVLRNRLLFVDLVDSTFETLQLI